LVNDWYQSNLLEKEENCQV